MSAPTTARSRSQPLHPDSFPHIFDAICLCATHQTLLALRLTNRSLRTRANVAFARHLVLAKDSHCRVPGGMRLPITPPNDKAKPAPSLEVLLTAKIIEFWEDDWKYLVRESTIASFAQHLAKGDRPPLEMLRCLSDDISDDDSDVLDDKPGLSETKNNAPPGESMSPIALNARVLVVWPDSSRTITTLTLPYLECFVLHRGAGPAAFDSIPQSAALRKVVLVDDFSNARSTLGVFSPMAKTIVKLMSRIQFVFVDYCTQPSSPGLLSRRKPPNPQLNSKTYGNSISALLRNLVANGVNTSGATVEELNACVDNIQFFDSKQYRATVGSYIFALHMCPGDTPAWSQEMVD